MFSAGCIPDAEKLPSRTPGFSETARNGRKSAELPTVISRTG